MPGDKKYLIGESLREKLRATVAKVDATPQGGARTRIPTAVGGGSAFVPKAFRMATFTGTWNINEAKTVTFRGVTTTPNTVSASNTFLTITRPNSEPAQCAIAKDGTAWYLVSWEPPQGIVRGTFTAPWAKGTTQAVSDAVTSSKSYPDVKNYFANVKGTGTKMCAIAYVGSEWVLIAAEC